MSFRRQKEKKETGFKVIIDLLRWIVYLLIIIATVLSAALVEYFFTR